MYIHLSPSVMVAARRRRHFLHLLVCGTSLSAENSSLSNKVDQIIESLTIKITDTDIVYKISSHLSCDYTITKSQRLSGVTSFVLGFVPF